MPEALRALVIDGAEGNPFYMEELVKMLIDDGVIAVDGRAAGACSTDKLLRAHVPPTLTGVLQARLDALGAERAPRMQQAAVVGHVFWDQALAAIDPAALDCLPLLLHKQLVVTRDAAAFDDTREYAFQHHLLHQVTYDSVLKAQRAARPRAGRRVLERARRGDQPAGGDAGRLPRAGRGAVPSLPGRPAGLRRLVRRASSPTTSMPMPRRRCDRWRSRWSSSASDTSGRTTSRPRAR